MINKISPIRVSNLGCKIYTPAFGQAKFTEQSRKSADSFEMSSNDFIDPSVYKKGFLGRLALSKKLDAGVSFQDLCFDYGCTSNPKSNAQFIKNHILGWNTPEYFAARHEVGLREFAESLIMLYNLNYDNPELSVKETKKLLLAAKAASDDSLYVRNRITDEIYIKNLGLLDSSTQRVRTGADDD